MDTHDCCAENARRSEPPQNVAPSTDRRSLWARIGAVLAAIVFHVQGMTCETCAIGIEKALTSRLDIARAHVDYPLGKVSVIPAAGHAPPENSIAETISALGYRVVREHPHKDSR